MPVVLPSILATDLYLHIELGQKDAMTYDSFLFGRNSYWSRENDISSFVVWKDHFEQEFQPEQEDDVDSAREEDSSSNDKAFQIVSVDH